MDQYFHIQHKQTDDQKAQEAKQRLAQIVKNENIHFNYFDEAQYGINNFPKQLSEIGVLCSKIKKKD